MKTMLDKLDALIARYEALQIRADEARDDLFRFRDELIRWMLKNKQAGGADDKTNPTV